MAALDPYADLVFNRLRARFYMERMAVPAALEAIRKPAELSGRPFAEDASKRLAENLSQVRVPGQQGTTSGQYVEPVQLQVVCYQLWENVKGRPPGQITQADLETVGDVDKALARFYRDALANVLAQPDVTISERQLRAWVDRELITEAGTRSIVYQSATDTGGVPNAIVRLLQDRFLLRAELRAGGTWLELTHDRLVEPIRADNTAWFAEHLSFVQKQAALWDAQQRPAGLLLTGQALDDAEAWAAANPEEVEAVERSFLDACRQAREVRLRQRRQNRMIRWLAAGAAIFGLIAALLAWVSFRQLDAVRQAQQQAETAAAAEATAKNVAEARRIAAEASQARAEAERDRAERQSQIARSRQAAATAVDALRRGEGIDALRLAVASYTITDTIEAENAMHQALVDWRGEGVLGPQEDLVSRAEFSPDGQVVATVAEQVIHLWEVGGQRRTLALRGHTKAVTDIAWSPDGRFLVTVSRDGTGRLWDRATGAEVWQALVPREGISVAFAPDGRSVAFGGDDAQVNEWQIEPFKLLRTLRHGSYGYAIRLRYSPDGQLLAGSYSDGLARVWRDGEATELRGHKDIVWDVAFSPDGQTIATRGNDDTVRLWRAATGEAIGVGGGARELEPWVNISPDGRYVAATSRTGVAYLWDMAKIGEPPYVLAGHTGPVTALAFSPDGRTAATTSFDKTAQLWDVETKTSRAVLAGHTDLVWWPAFSPDGRLLATTSSDQTARLWNPQLDEGGELAVRRYSSPVRLAGLAADGERVVAVQDGQAHVWNPATQQAQTFDTGVADVRAVAFDPVSFVLAIADGQGETTLWDAARGARMASIAPQEGLVVHALAFDPSGEFLAAARQDGAILVWNQSDQSLAATLTGHQNDATAVVFSPDGAWLASGSGDGTAKLWDWREERLARTYEAGAPAWAVAFSPDGATVAAATDAEEIRLWDVATDDDPPMVVLPGAGRVRSLAFSRDGDRLAAGDEQGAVGLWRWREGSRVGLAGHRRRVSDAVFHPDGRRLVTASQDGTVRVWPADPELTAQLVCERVGSSQADAEQEIGAEACADTPRRVWTATKQLPAPGPVVDPGSMLPQAGLPVIYYFEAVPGSQIAAGEPVELRWDHANATEVYLYEEDTLIKGVVPQDTLVVSPDQTTTYRLVARNALGETERRVTVTAKEH